MSTPEPDPTVSGTGPRAAPVDPWRLGLVERRAGAAHAGPRAAHRAPRPRHGVAAPTGALLDRARRRSGQRRARVRDRARRPACEATPGSSWCHWRSSRPRASSGCTRWPRRGCSCPRRTPASRSRRRSGCSSLPVFAAASSLDLSEAPGADCRDPRPVAAVGPGRPDGVVGRGVPRVARPLPAQPRGRAGLAARWSSLSVLGVTLYAFAVVRYLRLPRHPASALPLAMAGAFTLLAEAEIAIAWGRNWHASWWEWHLLMLAAFVLIAVSAQRSGGRRAGSASTARTPRRPSGRSRWCSPTCRGSRASPSGTSRSRSPRC